MDELLAFLRARLDEGERTAREADPDLSAVFTRIECFDTEMAADERHIMAHRPARVLREIEAHRTTVDEYDIALGAPAATDQAAYWKGHTETLREVCQRIATVYADHSDYREEWRP
ncbi:DUF6221 family protein [Streptomyces sp. 35G-GA-8]|uniref:DUF6221 family protein n=1 Tax=Streptomyces sp. 35G-GA-8 TaxID=2939434 RepID=UPI00201F34A2|nr:DUF6221 family protein [Streptomyces sp. 35G-GA-8]MCL7377452.1 DUF6221 family protein [Streptomyces sp. 35G-GA-8]